MWVPFCGRIFWLRLVEESFKFCAEICICICLMGEGIGCESSFFVESSFEVSNFVFSSFCENVLETARL